MRDEGSAKREKIRSSGCAFAYTDTTIFSRVGGKLCESDFDVVICHLNIRVRADIDVLSSPFPYPKYMKVLGVQRPFSKGLWKNETQTNVPINQNLKSTLKSKIIKYSFINSPCEEVGLLTHKSRITRISYKSKLKQNRRHCGAA